MSKKGSFIATHKKALEKQAKVDMDQCIQASMTFPNVVEAPETVFNVTMLKEEEQTISTTSDEAIPVEDSDLERVITVRDEDLSEAFASTVRISSSVRQSYPPRAVSILEAQPFTFNSAFSEPEWSSSKLIGLLPSKEVIFFDTETTGITNKYDRIIEIAFVHRNYATMMERRWYTLLNPEGRRSAKEAYNAHKIPHDSLLSQRTFSNIVDEMVAFIGDTVPLIAHNAAFDMRMFNNELTRLNRPLLTKDRFTCTYQMAMKMRGKAKGLNSLDRLCRDYNVDLSSRNDCHEAMQDTLLLADIYPFLLIDRSKLQ